MHSPVKPDFAVLVPTFNGGALLGETLRSCMAGALDPTRVAVIVCDNGSDDGSFEDATALASESGGLLNVHRNESNLGRVGNWNRCLEVAESMGAFAVSYLMVGDEWVPGANAVALVEAVRRAAAPLTLARYQIVDASGRRLRVGRNFVGEHDRVVDAPTFVAAALREGALPFGPLQANVYRLGGGQRLRFDPEDPTHTDQRATLAFLGIGAAPLLLRAEPYAAWKVHAGRFHMAMDLRRKLNENVAMIRALADERRLTLDDRRLNANLFLEAAREWIGRPNGWTRVREAADTFRALPGGLDWTLVSRLVFRRVVLRRFFWS